MIIANIELVNNLTKNLLNLDSLNLFKYFFKIKYKLIHDIDIDNNI